MSYASLSWTFIRNRTGCFYLIIFQSFKCDNLSFAWGLIRCQFWIEYQFECTKKKLSGLIFISSDYSNLHTKTPVWLLKSMQDPSFDHKTGLVYCWLALCLEMCSLVCCWLLFSVANSNLSNFLYSAIAPPSKLLAVRRLRRSVESLWLLSTNCDWNWVVLELELILNNSYFYWNYCNPKKREKLLESAVYTWLGTAMKMGKW